MEIDTLRPAGLEARLAEVQTQLAWTRLGLTTAMLIGAILTAVVLTGLGQRVVEAEARLRSLQRTTESIEARLPRLIEAATGTPAKITVQSIELVDPQGRPRADFYGTVNGPVLMLYDAQGRTRAILFVIQSGPHLDFADEQGERRANLTVFQGRGSLRLWNAAGMTAFSAP